MVNVVGKKENDVTSKNPRCTSSVAARRFLGALRAACCSNRGASVIAGAPRQQSGGGAQPRKPRLLTEMALDALSRR